MSDRWKAGFIQYFFDPLTEGPLVLPGSLYSWGFNNQGQLGQNDTVSRSSPVQIGAQSVWLSVNSGTYHSLAIKNDGTLWAWGENEYGKLGNNSTANTSSPIQIGALTNWSSAVGSASSSAAIKTDGTLWTWGRNGNYGQLGQGNTIDRSSPVQVGALTNWQSIVCGLDFFLAKKTDGTIWSWGRNTDGMLGDNTSANKSSPVQIGSLTTWNYIGSAYYSGFGVKTDGTLWAWGYNNYYGQLGDGTTINRSSPVQIGALTNWKNTTGGSTHTLAVKADGTLWSWGSNQQSGIIAGQLGDNTPNARSSPAQVGSLNNWQLVKASSYNSLAIKTNNTLWGWGENFAGGIGSGNNIKYSSPVQIGSLTTWSSVSCGANNTVAIQGS